MYRIGVIGDRDSVLGFQALGLEAAPAENAEEARQALHRMAKENFAIVYLTEQLAAQLQRRRFAARKRQKVGQMAFLFLFLYHDGAPRVAAHLAV